MRLPRALELGEFREDEPDGLLYALVWVLLDPVAPNLHKAGCNAEYERAATRAFCFSAS
jgi:hypothetical protein